jgi:hypothetical protein
MTMHTRPIQVGTRVKPRGEAPTKNDITYGYVRAISGDDVWVYWPEIKSEGKWPLTQLEPK